MLLSPPRPSASPARRIGRRRFRSWRARGGPIALLFALPVVAIFAYFAWGPILRALIMSLQRTNLISAPEWVGVENFAYVLADPLLGTAVRNTLWFALLALIFGFPVPLFLAVFMAELRAKRGLFTVLAYLPVMVPPVVAILLWKTFYHPSSTGLFNTVLSWFHIPPQPWLNSPDMAMPAIVLEATWAGAGSAVIIYLAALTAVRTELYEAAELDGAGIWSRVWHVTLPQIRGVILIMVLLLLIGAMQVFTEPYLFTGGGPMNATISVMMLIYNYAFLFGDYGAATALSLLLAVALGILSAVFHLATRKWSQDQ